MFVVFGVWAALAGAAQLVVALRRRALLGRQGPMLLAGGVSVLFGIAFGTAAAVGHAMLIMLALYAATGGVDFIIQAWLLVATAPSCRRCAPAPQLELTTATDERCLASGSPRL